MFYLHKEFRGAGIRFYLHKDFRADGIEFYLHKEFRVAGSRFYLHKEFLNKNHAKTMIYLKNFRAARANLLRISEVNHEKSMMIIFRATRANLLRIHEKSMMYV